MNTYTLPYNAFLDCSPIGTEKFCSGKTPVNYIAEQGQIILTKEYPYLFKYAIENDLIVTEEEWQSQKLFALFAYGETPNTFRLPDKRGLSPIGFEQGYHNKLGGYVQDQIVNITGNVFIEAVHSSFTGAFFDSGISSTVMGNNKFTSNGGVGFNASRVVKTGKRVQARGFTGNWIIKYR